MTKFEAFFSYQEVRIKDPADTWGLERTSSTVNANPSALLVPVMRYETMMGQEWP